MSRGDGRRDIYSLDWAPAVKALLSGNLVRAACLALTLLAGAGCNGVSKDFDAAIQERIRNATYHMQTITDLVEEKIGIDDNYHERLLAFGFEEQEVIRPAEQLLEKYDADSYRVYEKYYRRRIVSYWSVTVTVYLRNGEYSNIYAYLFLSSL